MVAMASRGSAQTLLRVGSRIAGRLATDWYAVYVETPKEEPGRIKPEDHVALQDNIRFARAARRDGREAEGLARRRPARRLREARRDHARDLRPVGALALGSARCAARSSIASCATCATRRCRSCRSAAPAGAGGRPPWRVAGDEAADQTAARLRRLRAGARPARRVERAHAQPDERRVRARSSPRTTTRWSPRRT